MTNQEAIIQLDYLKDFKTPDQVKALDMAIKALSTKTCLDCGYQYLDDDECPRCGSERWE